MTEEEAKTKWCPFARVGSEGNRAFDVGNTIQADCHCIGSACMAWRWTLLPILGDAGFVRGHRQTDQGFCGLAGKP